MNDFERENFLKSLPPTTFTSGSPTHCDRPSPSGKKTVRGLISIPRTGNGEIWAVDDFYNLSGKLVYSKVFAFGHSVTWHDGSGKLIKNMSCFKNEPEELSRYSDEWKIRKK